MRRKQWTLALLAVLLTGIAARAQEKPAAEKRPPTAVTVQVVFSEFEGEKKIGSLPYTIPINSEPDQRAADWSQVRMGVRVPIVTGSKEGVIQTQYMDVGTNIDCRAWMEGSHYAVDLRLERSSLYLVGAEGKRVEWSPDERGVGIAAQPIVRQYRSTMTLLMRDGQTIQRAVATDPLSGRQVRVDVTLNVVK
jgi:hypothetical protein